MTDTFTPVSAIGEFGLIARMRAQLTATNPDVVMAIGDDAAVYRTSDDMCDVITTDVLIEGVHFDRSFIPMSHLGEKAIAVNVSDVVAMNAEPIAATVTLGVPRSMSVEMVDALYAGMNQACADYGLQLVGGDTSTAPSIILSVTVVGRARQQDVVFRRGARPGDLLCVSGDLGGAYAGLKILLDQRRAMEELGDGYQPDIEPYRNVIRRQLRPTARLDVLQAFRTAGVKPRALIDVSDGLSSETQHLARASSCGARVFGSAIPIDPETRAVASEQMEEVDTYALFGGEDYELLFALDPADNDRLDQSLFTVIGEFTDSDDVVLRTEDGVDVAIDGSGWDHFSGSGDGSA